MVYLNGISHSDARLARSVSSQMTWSLTGGLASHRMALSEEYSLCCTAAFVYEEGTYRLGLCTCQALWILRRANHAAASAETRWLQARQEMNGDNDRSAWCMSAIGACSYPRHASLASAFISVAVKKKKDRFLLWQLWILWLQFSCRFMDRWGRWADWQEGCCISGKTP